ncbi:hypothetical protein [Roseibium denhamense]|uniref:Uncharacterized protein n=1 Tax=Roseibium denhamense TaxID=76305 RepID=A0ABY1NSB3_9HYPH|nr:hypothetical protein [Roseibium denhamense]SMP16696.1 hypothetical protein SAMN06265374_1739 [Roseibium denhamense]
MLDIYARSFLEASRFTPSTRIDPRTQRHLDKDAEKRERHTRLWRRGPYWI